MDPPTRKPVEPLKPEVRLLLLRIRRQKEYIRQLEARIAAAEAAREALRDVLAAWKEPARGPGENGP